MKKIFPSFDLGIDHLLNKYCIYIALYPVMLKALSLRPVERKQKKEEQQPFACLDVSELDDLAEGAQAKTKYYATKYTVNVFQNNFCI